MSGSLSLIITEKPSVAMEFAKAVGATSRGDGYVEGNGYVITWCVGHLITMSYPEKYGEEFREWKLDTLPFIPQTFKYEVIDSVKDQYKVVAYQMKRPDIGTIYYSGDSAREGEYIQRLVRQMVKPSGKKEMRVWIDSQTQEEILRGIREAKPLSYYDKLSDAAYMRAAEDYLFGINLSRAFSVRFGNLYNTLAGSAKYEAIAVGRVMTCVLGMIVERERLIRGAKSIPYYGVTGLLEDNGTGEGTDSKVNTNWAPDEQSKYYGSPLLFKDGAFAEQPEADRFVAELNADGHLFLEKRTITKETKRPPLLYNLAELQGKASATLKISPDKTLDTVQSLYEKKMVTYPRTDARVLSSAIAKEIGRNVSGLSGHPVYGSVATQVSHLPSVGTIGTSRYTDDSRVSDHYAIIPTGAGLENYGGLSDLERNVYNMICARFLSIFMDAAEYQKVSCIYRCGKEKFTASAQKLVKAGYLAVQGEDEDTNENADKTAYAALSGQREGKVFPATFAVKAGKTSPPKRYTSGSMILAMENAGQLIEDRELRETIKGTGIGTSATRAETVKKLVRNGYIRLDNKTQVLTPSKGGEVIYDIVKAITPSLLKPEMTANWEKGLAQVENGVISRDDFFAKMCMYVTREVTAVKTTNMEDVLKAVPGAKNASVAKNNYSQARAAKPLPKFKGKSPKKFPDKCPYCGNAFKEFDWGTTCRCGVLIPKIVAEVTLSEADRIDLLYKGKTEVVKDLVKKDKSGTYDARLKVTDGWKIKPDFSK